MSRMSLFITCPVESVARATAFYTARGWTLNAKMSDHNVSCFAIAPEQYVMLGSREMYASVGGAEELVGGPHTPSKVTVSFDLGSREAVDALAERAAAAGGRIGDTDDYPFMYQRQFDDPDGYHYSPFWMKPDADPTACATWPRPWTSSEHGGPCSSSNGCSRGRSDTATCSATSACRPTSSPLACASSKRP